MVGMEKTVTMDMTVVFFFSSRRRHTRCALVTGVQTCALPICNTHHIGVAHIGMSRDQLLDLDRGHVDATALDDFLQSRMEDEAAIGIELAEIPGVEEPVGEIGRAHV